MLPTRAATVVALAIAFHAVPVAADQVVLRADPYCPYNCEPGSDSPGFMIEIAREALAMHGHTVVYENAPWARALEMARTGVIAGAVGALPEEAPDLLYGIPIGSYSEAVALRIGETIDSETPSTYDGWRIGIIDGYEYYGPIAAYIEANAGDRTVVQSAGGDQPLDTNLRKLRARRIDMVADAEAVLAYNLLQNGLEDELTIVRMSDADAIYIGFSPANPASATYLEHLEDGVATLRKSGRLAEILSRYGVADWAE
ncbi:substrate-binding periplasmic protein [Jannaschia donghaensis]|uniref:Bacterial extracellular solute-binding proteins, family 3 n=1 Tax=Jannaschia donghaensis TaxID=420998 RepID=A0A0M6YPI2_9RHOB|nr:transporter substrate-binding domain-containing protein [Jannaschia donghaensis]CTQ51443.1 Bacterial extracellular solute-binding proteins, family 3 [Jannaschia donghaensis]